MTRLRRLAAVYVAKFRVEIANQLAYRGAIVIWLLGLLVQPIVYLVVWTTVAESRGGEVGGFGKGDFAAYFTLMMIVNQLTFTWNFYFFEWRIRSGEFSPVLLRPIHPIHNDIAENVAFKMLTFTVVLPVAVFLVVTFGATFRGEWWQVIAFAPALVLAMALRFVIEWTLALAAFWITRTQALNEAYYVAMLFLSGQVAPLALYPDAVQAIAFVLPFRWMVSFPVEAALGRLGPAEVAVGFAMQVLWIGMGLGLLRLAWRDGIRRYSAVGA